MDTTRAQRKKVIPGTPGKGIWSKKQGFRDAGERWCCCTRQEVECSVAYVPLRVTRHSNIIVVVK